MAAKRTIKVIKSDGSLSRWITPEITRQLIDANSINSVKKVNKRQCGNAGSSAFEATKPSKGKVIFIVTPHRSIPRDKKRAYERDKANGKLRHNNKVGHFYGGSSESLEDYLQYDVVYTTWDLLKRFEPKMFGNNIEAIVLDEAHAFLEGESFRGNFRGLARRVGKYCKNIISITATPHNESNIDFEIITAPPLPVDLNVIHNLDILTDIIKTHYDNGVMQLIFTQDIRVIGKIKTAIFGNSNLRCELKVGSSLESTILSNYNYEEEQGKLLFASSAGMEGWDYEEDRDVVVSFIEDRVEDRTRFYHTNIIQAINRKRNKRPIEAYYHSRPRSGTTPLKFMGENIISESAVERFVKNVDISDKKKLSGKNKKYAPYVDQYLDGEKAILSVNRDIYDVVESAIKMDGGIYSFREYFEKRGVTLVDYNSNNNYTKKKVTSDRVKRQRHLFNSRDYLDKKVDGWDLSSKQCKKIYTPSAVKGAVVSDEDFIKNLIKDTQKKWNRFIDEVNYDHKYGMPDNEGNVALDCAYPSMNIANRLINDEEAFRSLLKRFGDMSIARFKEKQTYPRSSEAKAELEEYKTDKYYYINAINLLVNLANPEGGHLTGSSYTIDREFSSLTNTSTNVRKDIIKLLGLNAVCMDVKQCNPNIDANLSGMPNLELYGATEGKARTKAKLKLLMTLNTLKVDANSEGSFKTLKSRKTQTLIDLGYDEVTAHNVTNKYCGSKFTNEYYNEHSFYEREIVDDFRYHIQRIVNDDVRILRLHDSLVLVSARSLPIDPLRLVAEGFTKDIKECKRHTPLDYKVGDVKETTWFGFEIWNEVNGGKDDFLDGLTPAEFCLNRLDNAA